MPIGAIAERVAATARPREPWPPPPPGPDRQRPMRHVEPGNLAPTLGENLRAARLGYAWCAPLAAWLRIEAVEGRDDRHRFTLAPNRNDLDQPLRGAAKAPRRCRCWWEVRADEPMMVEVVRRHVATDDRGHVVTASTFVVDDDGDLADP